MIRLAVLVLVAAAVAPLVVEQTMAPCDALERRLVYLASRDSDDPALSNLLGGIVQQLSRGGLAAIAVKEQYPNLPPPLACYFVYYEAYYDSLVGS